MNPAPYHGILILDLTVAQQGPVATQILADFGADVIKIERPGTGDPMRGADNHGGCGSSPSDECRPNPAFIACNRNKRSLTLDLKSPAARPVMLDLVHRADVFVANFRPGVLKRLGLDYESLQSVNPRLIHATSTGYGETGPYANRKGQDMAGQCLGGLSALSQGGNPTRRPVAPGYNVCDLLGGTLLAQGIMAALAARASSGLGQQVTTNLLNAALFADLLGHTETLNSLPDDAAAPRASNPTYAYYRAADGRWVHIIDAFSPTPLLSICRALNLPETIAADPRFANCNGLTQADAEELSSDLSAACSRFTADEIIARFDAQDMLAVPVLTSAETLRDPQVLHNEMILHSNFPDGSPQRLLGFPVKLSATPASLRLPPPALGADTHAILSGLLGYSPKHIDQLPV